MATKIKLAQIIQDGASDGQVVAWNNGAGKWEPATSSGGGSFSTITVAEFTADQNDFNPAGFSTADVIRVSSDSGMRGITGMAADDPAKTKTFRNIGTQVIFFYGEHPSSTNVNRFTLSSDYALFPGDSVSFKYDDTLDKWYIYSSSIQEDSPYVRRYALSPGSTTAADWGDVAFGGVNTGTLITGSAINGRASRYVLRTGATNINSGYYFNFAKTTGAHTWAGQNFAEISVLVGIPVLSDATDTFQVAVRLANASTAVTNNNSEVGIRYAHDTNGGKWECFSINNIGTETVLDSGVTVVASTLYALTCSLNETATEARFYINGVMVGVITTNLPAVALVSKVTIWKKNAGSSIRELDLHRFTTRIIHPAS